MMRELLNRTDEDHTLNATEMIRILEEYGCEADRRTIYSNAPTTWPVSSSIASAAASC